MSILGDLGAALFQPSSPDAAGYANSDISNKLDSGSKTNFFSGLIDGLTGAISAKADTIGQYVGTQLAGGTSNTKATGNSGSVYPTDDIPAAYLAAQQNAATGVSNAQVAANVSTPQLSSTPHYYIFGAAAIISLALVFGLANRRG